MTNSEYLIKLLEEEDGAIMDYLTCEACLYRNKTCDAFKKTCDRGHSRWLKKEREEEKMAEELKPCPFCGCKIAIERKGWFRSDTIIDQYKLVGKHKEGCIFHELSWMGGYETQDEAIEAWNRRVKQ